MFHSRSDPNHPGADPAGTPAEARLRSNILTPLVALLAHPDDEAAAQFREIFEDVACDWRLVRVADGSTGAKHIMNKGLPELVVLACHVPEVTGPELIGWMRSFRGGASVPVLVLGEPTDEGLSEQFRRHDIKAMIPLSAPRQILAAQLAELVAHAEKRRFALPL